MVARLPLLMTCVAAAALQGCARPHGSRLPDRVRIAGIILKWVPAQRELNYSRAEPMIRRAAAAGAQIVVTTECFLDGYAIRDKSMPPEAWRALGEEIPEGPYLRRLRHLADEVDIHLVAGLVERDGDRTYNTAVLIGPDGRVIGRYRKQKLGDERARNTAGCESPAFDTPHGRIGLIICADRRDPEVVRRICANGVDLLICPSGGMWGPKDNDHHVQARSRENRVPIVFVHPIDFLVTGPDGAILERRFVGREMDVSGRRIGSEQDVCEVAIFDVPLSGARRQRQVPRDPPGGDDPYCTAPFVSRMKAVSRSTSSSRSSRS